MRYDPYAGDVAAPDGITLAEYARAWVDMAPHTGQLTDLAREARTIVEWGLRGGVSTWALLDGLPADGVLYGVDILPTHYLRLNKRVTEDPRFHLVSGDSLTVPLPKHADLLMIDSSHEYEQTIKELDRAVTLTPYVIAMHDYLYREDPTCKVHEALDEWLKTGSYKISHIYPSKWGLTLLVAK